MNFVIKNRAIQQFLTQNYTNVLPLSGQIFNFAKPQPNEGDGEKAQKPAAQDKSANKAAKGGKKDKGGKKKWFSWQNTCD